uniref:Uncharacterized protein n=1 Tax=Nelumbo nucifera TaxID=4432 RepID=A0A822YJR2_NELNU|nr:TPA_asm: hypothetical protein HUJ06_010400 [Nelumbo nucifera]
MAYVRHASMFFYVRPFFLAAGGYGKEFDGRKKWKKPSVRLTIERM